MANEEIGEAGKNHGVIDEVVQRFLQRGRFDLLA
jgi:hypothetical protein